jgi:DNA-3-methyladenine glycosylase
MIAVMSSMAILQFLSFLRILGVKVFSLSLIMPRQLLKQNFYNRDTHEVARDLLGKLLVRDVSGRQLTGRIFEVEAYVGEDDAACHAARGRTARTEVMYGPPGRAYVYLIYGMHNMLNIVTEAEGFPAAILIRGLASPSPDKGRLGGVPSSRTAPMFTPGVDMSGPGKLTQALQIDRTLNAHDMTQSEQLFVADDGFKPRHIQTGPRIGVDYAGEDAKLPWRYFTGL